MVIEGPIITVISGFLIKLGFLNATITVPLLIVGDITGDLLHYYVGKYISRFGWAQNLGYLFGYKKKKEKTLEENFKKNTGRTILLSKISHGIGGIIQISAGVAKVDVKEFLTYSFIGTVPKALILLLLGYYIGSSYQKIDSIFDAVANVTITIFVLVILYILARTLTRKLNKSVDRDQ